MKNRTIYVTILIILLVFTPLFNSLNINKDLQIKTSIEIKRINSSNRYSPEKLLNSETENIIILFKSLEKAKKFSRNLHESILFDPLPIVYLKSIKNKEKITRFLPYIKYMGKNRHFKLQMMEIRNTENPISTLQTHLNTINATPLHKNYTGRNIRVAIIDTGINEHQDLRGRIILQKSFVRTIYGYPVDSNDTTDKIGHGTSVALTLAANGSYTGVAPDALLINAKVFYGSQSNYVATEAGIIAAIRWAVAEANADIINLSLGGPAILNDPLLEVVKWASENGVIVVVAAGNEGSDGLGTMQISTPGISKYAITVGATDVNGIGVAHYSSLGPIYDMSIKPDLVAPGVFNGYLGTSFAAPHVAGAIALLLEYLDVMNFIPSSGLEKVAVIKTALIATSVSLGYSDVAEGAGLVNVGKAWWMMKKYIELGKVPDLFMVLPKKLPAGFGFPYHDKLFLGMNLVFNFTLYSSINRSIRISLEGNITEAFNFSGFDIDVVIPHVNWEFNLTIPRDVQIGYYVGKIIFREGIKKLFEIPVEFHLVEPRGFILFDLRHTSWLIDAKYGQYREYFKLAESMDLAVEQIFWGESKLTLRKLLKYDLVFMPDTASYYVLYDQEGSYIGLTSKIFTKEEIDAIKKYVKNGGFIIFISMIPIEEDTGNNITNVNELSREFGVLYETHPLILKENPIPSNTLNTPILGINNTTLPFNGATLKITNSTSTSYFLRFSYSGFDYYGNFYSGEFYGGAIYTDRSGGLALFLSTNFFFDNWAFNGKYGTSVSEASNVRRVHQAIFDVISYKKNILITPLKEKPKLGEVVRLNVTIVNLNYTSIEIYVHDLLGKFKVENISKISNDMYLVSFKPRHAKYISIIVRLKLQSGKFVIKSYPIFVEPLEYNIPNLVSIYPPNDTLIKTDLYDQGTLSFNLAFSDDSEIIYEATEIHAYVKGEGVDIVTNEENQGFKEIPVDVSFFEIDKGKEVNVTLTISKQDIINTVTLAKQITILISLQVYDINANLLDIKISYTLIQKGGLGIFEIASLAFLVFTLFLVIMILLKFRKKEETVIYYSR